MAEEEKSQSQSPTPPPVPARVDPMAKIIKHSGDHGEHMVTRPITFGTRREDRKG